MPREKCNILTKTLHFAFEPSDRSSHISTVGFEFGKAFSERGGLIARPVHVNIRKISVAWSHASEHNHPTCARKVTDV